MKHLKHLMLIAMCLCGVSLGVAQLSPEGAINIYATVQTMGIVISQNGSVGLGLAAPLTKLEVAGDVSANRFIGAVTASDGAFSGTLSVNGQATMTVLTVNTVVSASRFVGDVSGSDASFSGTLVVTGQTTMTSLTVNGVVSASQLVGDYIGASSTISGTLTILGLATFSTLSVNGTLSANTFAGTISGNNASYSGILDVAGATTMSSLTVNGLVSANSFSGNVGGRNGSYLGDLDVAGQSTLASLTVNGIVSANKFAGSISLGDVFFPGDLNVVGLTRMTSLTVNGDISANRVVGNVSGNNGSFSSAMSVAGRTTMTALTVNGVVSANAFVGAVSAAAGTFSATLNVVGQSTLELLTVNGVISANQLMIESLLSDRATVNNLYVNGGVNIASSATVNGVVSANLFAGNVSGNSGYLSGTLGVTGQTTMASLTVNGVISANQFFGRVRGTNGTLSGTVFVSGLTTVASLTINGVVSANTFVGSVSANNGTFTGTLSVTGQSTMTSVTINGVVSANKFVGNYIGNNNVTVNGTLAVSGQSTLSSLTVNTVISANRFVATTVSGGGGSFSGTLAGTGQMTMTALSVNGVISSNGLSVQQNSNASQFVVREFSGQTQDNAPFALYGRNGSLSLEMLAGTSNLKNTFIGLYSGRSNDTGYNNAALGSRALSTNTTGYSNTAIGYQAGTGLLSGGIGNVFIGSRAGYSQTTGSGNILIGNGVTASNTAGDNQLNIGSTIYGDLTSGSRKIGINNYAPQESLDVFGSFAVETAVNVDSLFVSTNGRVGLGGIVSPSTALEVSGNVSANRLLGQAVSANNTVSANMGYLPGILRVTGQTTMASLTVNGVVSANSFVGISTGDATLITAINASNFSSGVISPNYLTVVSNNYSSGLSINGTLSVNHLFSLDPATADYYPTTLAVTDTLFLNDFAPWWTMIQAWNAIGLTFKTSAGTGRIVLAVNGTVQVLVISADGLTVPVNIMPNVSGNGSVGTSALPWGTMYDTAGTIQASDRNKKKNIKDSILGLDFIRSLRPVSYVWKVNPNGTHYGLIAQEVESALTGKDFAGLSRPDGNGGGYGLGYTEFIAPIIKAAQQLSQKNKQLKNDILGLRKEIREFGLLEN